MIFSELQGYHRRVGWWGVFLHDTFSRNMANVLGCDFFFAKTTITCEPRACYQLAIVPLLNGCSFFSQRGEKTPICGKSASIYACHAKKEQQVPEGTAEDWSLKAPFRNDVSL